jgi:hypothetical protein
MPHQPNAPAPWEQPLREPVPPSTPASLSLLMKRYLPRWLGGGELLEPAQQQRGDPRFAPTDEDIDLPMEIGTFRDPRLPPPSGWDAIRGGYEQVKDLGRPGSIDELRKRLDRGTR